MKHNNKKSRIIAAPIIVLIVFRNSIAINRLTKWCHHQWITGRLVDIGWWLVVNLDVKPVREGLVVSQLRNNLGCNCFFGAHVAPWVQYGVWIRSFKIKNGNRPRNIPSPDSNKKFGLNPYLFFIYLILWIIKYKYLMRSCPVYLRSFSFFFRKMLYFPKKIWSRRAGPVFWIKIMSLQGVSNTNQLNDHQPSAFLTFSLRPAVWRHRVGPVFSRNSKVPTRMQALKKGKNTEADSECDDE